MVKAFTCISFVILLNIWASAQVASTYYFHLDKLTLKEKIVVDSTHSASKYFTKAETNFNLQGYTGVFLQDSLIKSNTHHYYYNYKNKFSNIELIQLNSKRNKSSKQKNYAQLSSALNTRLKDLENNGYPFASIKIIKQEEKVKTLKLTYEIDSGQFYIIDKIHIKSQENFHDKTVENIIGIATGDVYNEKKINAIPLLLSSSGLYKTIRASQVLFKEKSAELFIYISKEKSSTADGYIGFQQDQITSKLVLNGYVNLQLYNSFKRAEIIDLRWKSNPDKTQNFAGKLEYPYLFNTPFGIGTKLDLRKQDSTFLRTDITFNLNYNHPVVKVSLFDQLESSSTLRDSAPSAYRNYAKNTIGASILLKVPSIQVLPFYHPEFFLLGGFFNYRDDTIDDNKQKIANRKYQIGYKHKIDFLKYFHLNNKIEFEGLSSNISLARNELPYFGGLNSIRGFYELELSGNDIWKFMNELEYKPIELLSVFILYDYSVYKFNGLHFTNSLGFGFGLSANNTRLEIVVANGVLDKNPVSLSNTKIHLGFKSTF